MDELVVDAVDQCARDLSVSFDVPSTIVADRYSYYSSNSLFMEEQSLAGIVILINVKGCVKNSHDFNNTYFTSCCYAVQDDA